MKGVRLIYVIYKNEIPPFGQANPGDWICLGAPFPERKITSDHLFQIEDYLILTG